MLSAAFERWRAAGQRPVASATVAPADEITAGAWLRAFCRAHVAERSWSAGHLVARVGILFGISTACVNPHKLEKTALRCTRGRCASVPLRSFSV
jgi:hypothetical protein